MLWIYLLSGSAIHLLVSSDYSSCWSSCYSSSCCCSTAMGYTGSNAVTCYYIPCYMYYGAPYHAIGLLLDLCICQCWQSVGSPAHAVGVLMVSTMLLLQCITTYSMLQWICQWLVYWSVGLLLVTVYSCYVPLLVVWQCSHVSSLLSICQCLYLLVSLLILLVILPVITHPTSHPTGYSTLLWVTPLIGQTSVTSIPTMSILTPVL